MLRIETPARSARDPRLDFFRGAAMFVIYIAHCRGDLLWDYIPPRYGLSDSANMFVFLSGMAAAIAFGGTFQRLGWVIGTARILHRCWQLLVAHLGLFFTGAMLAAAGTRWFADENYIEVLGLQRFFADPAGALIGLFTLTYVPHYFDILPLYIVVLAMVPIAMPLSRLSPLVPVAASLALYVAAVVLRWNFPANADDQPQWFFDPLAWQLIFFTGFALRRGWIKVPLSSPLLLWGAIGILLIGLAVSLPSVFTRIGPVDWLRQWIYDHTDKTYLDPLEYLHFLALAYVLVVALKGREQILLSPPLRQFVKCGQQALATFLTGMILSHASSMIFDHVGTGIAAQVAINGVAFTLMFCVAYLVAWVKSAPWRRQPVAVAAPIPVTPESDREAAAEPGRAVA